MSFSTDFLPLMDDVIKVSTRTTHSFSGEPSFAATTATYSARVVEKPGYTHGPEMEEIAYRHVAWVRSTGTVSITATDRVTVNGTIRPVVGVERYPDETGPHHVKVLFGY